MKNRLIFSIAVFLLLTLGKTAFSQNSVNRIPRTISYQGYVTDVSKKPLTGNHLIAFRLYDSPVEGTLLHSEKFNAPVVNGVFSLAIGSQEAISTALQFDRPYWIGVSIDGDQELSPRTSFTSVPYAIHAESASTLAKGASGAITSLNGKSGDISIQGGAGIQVSTEGKNVTITSLGSSNVATALANNVTSVTGTANQVTAAPTTGAVILSLPQNINTAASPTFKGLTLTGLGSGIVHASGAGLLSSSAITNSDISSTADIDDSKLGTITTAGKVDNSATTATSKNIAGAIVARNASGNFVAGTITATLKGNATGTAANITGIATELHGGTNQDTYASGDMLYASAANTLAKRTIGSNGNIMSVASGAPVWSDPNTIVVTSATGTANQILVNSDALAHNGAISLSLPQSIATTSSPSFATLTLTGKATSASTGAADAAGTLATKDYVDNTAKSNWSLAGNTGTTAANYIGTTDATNLSFATNATERMKLTSDGSLLLTGNSGAVPASNSGTRMMWIPSLGAFRAGRASGTEWDAGNIGLQSFSVGFGSYALGNQSVAGGYFTSAYGFGSTAIGVGASAFADGSTAFGAGAQAVGINSVAMGDNTTAWGVGTTALGGNTSASGLYSTALGFNTTTTDDYSIVIGRNLKIGKESFGFNGSPTSTVTDISDLSNIAYFGDVDILVGNSDNSSRSVRFYGKNSDPTLTSKYTSIKAGTQTENISYTLPTVQGSAGSYLTNNGTGTLSWSSQNSAYASISAGDEIDIPANTSVVKIDDNSDNAPLNAVVLPSGSNGQILYIFNNDAEATTGDAIINAGSTATFIYADGWRRAN
ncbi:MAG: hypothetical protein WCH46_10600 [bacterium]